MNPEEGELRPQLLDRFPLHVSVGGGLSVEQRMDLVKRNLAFESEPEEFRETWEEEQSKLRVKIINAQSILHEVILPEANLRAFESGVEEFKRTVPL